MKTYILKFTNLLKQLNTGFIAGIILAFALQKNIWISMRFNTGLLIPISVLVTLLLCKYYKVHLKLSSFLTAEIIFISVFLIASDFSADAFLVVPAALLREGLFLDGVKLKVINIFILALLLSGNISWMLKPDSLKQ